MRGKIVEGNIYHVLSRGVDKRKIFLLKYERTGTLFSSRYKSVPVTDESHFIHLPYYIHMNPLDLVAPEWRKRELTNFSGTQRNIAKTPCSGSGK